MILRTYELCVGCRCRGITIMLMFFWWKSSAKLKQVIQVWSAKPIIHIGFPKQFFIRKIGDKVHKSGVFEGKIFWVQGILFHHNIPKVYSWILGKLPWWIFFSQPTSFFGSYWQNWNLATKPAKKNRLWPTVFWLEMYQKKRDAELTHADGIHLGSWSTTMGI